MTPEIKNRIEQIQRGEVPEGYKKTRVGIVPTEWDSAKMRNMFDRLNKKNKDGNTNVLTISAQHGLINQEEYFNKSIASEDKSNYFLLKQGDFAYNKSYSAGYPFGAIKSLTAYDEGIVSPLYICFTPAKENKCPEFFEQYFEGGMLNREIQAVAQEGARNHGLLNIAVDDFFSSNITAPPLAEQKKIAEILAAQDKVIELKEKLLEEKKKQKNHLMQQLLTGKKRLPGFSGEWKSVRVKQLGEIVTGATPSRKDLTLWGGNCPWISARDFKGKYINSSVEAISNAGKNHCRLLPPKAVLVTCIASIGLNAITNVECATNQQINAIICNNDYSSEFVYYIFESKANLLKRLAGKTAVPIISKQQFESITLYIPDNIYEQNAIAKKLAVADCEIDLWQKEINAEKQKKKALMQLLLTGIVRVNV